MSEEAPGRVTSNHRNGSSPGLLIPQSVCILIIISNSTHVLRNRDAFSRYPVDAAGHSGYIANYNRYTGIESVPRNEYRGSSIRDNIR